MLLEGFLVRDGIEKELPALLFVVIAAAVAAVLRHVLSPFLVELCEVIEFLLEVLVLPGGVLVVALRNFLFQDRVGLEFLLNDVAQL